MRPKKKRAKPGAEIMAARIGGWMLYFAIVAALIYVGWHEPLNYRFKSRAEIYAIEHPATPTPAPKPVTPKPGAWMTETARTTKLDGGPRDNQRSIYRPPQTPFPNSAR